MESPTDKRSQTRLLAGVHIRGAFIEGGLIFGVVNAVEVGDQCRQTKALIYR
jgi:hypothetical protein